MIVATSVRVAIILASNLHHASLGCSSAVDYTSHRADGEKDCMNDPFEEQNP